MDCTHIIVAVLLNLFSIQMTFCGTGDPMMYLTPSTYEMRSMGVQPFIQAQIHPASGTIQQGIMLPQQHPMPQERAPEDFYYQERMVPQGSMVHQERMLPFEHIVPQESFQQERLVPHGNIMPQEHLMLEPQETIIPQERMVPQENVQHIVHTNPTHAQPTQKQEQNKNDVVEAHNNLRSEDDQRAVKSGYEYSHQQTYPQAPSFGYGSANPSYNTHAPSASSYSPPAADHSDPATKFLLKPDLTELITPVTGKMAGKLSGLAGLGLSLLGSGKGLELTGIKDLLIDGILKPLLVAKGGLKALISKLAIPVIALILINVEVLITVWWLWEDCPDVKHEVVYTKPSYPTGGAATSNYNYR